MLFLAAAGGLAFELRTNGVFACPALGYDADRYLGYCNARSYADFDHGAFWFGLEPAAVQAAARAEVLFIGNSRLQFGLSTRTTLDWFAEAGLSHYLLGFSNAENVVFFEPMLAELGPSATVYVINVDGFFLDFQTPPVRDLFSRTGDIAVRYRQKQLWQIPHQLICTTVPAACGNDVAFFRARGDGHWVINGTRGLRPGPVGELDVDDNRSLTSRFTRAEEFVSQLPVDRNCIVMTIVPSGETDFDSARTIADRLGILFVAPRLDELRTFDGSHLDPDSAEQWSTAFLDRAESTVLECTRARSSVEDGMPHVPANDPR